MDIKFTACTPAGFKIKTLYEDFYKLNKIDFNAEYQRSEIWRLPKKQLLLDSILRNFDISKIFLRQLVDGRYECLDGQQRLKAIFGYLKDEFSLSGKETPEVGPKRFSELGNELQWRIWSYAIYATLVHNVDDPTTCRIFLRLQEGMPLNSAEKLNANLGEVRDVVFELSKHKFFSLSGLPEYRFFRRYVAAQILLLESKGGPSNAKFPNLRQGLLPRQLSSWNLHQVRRRAVSSCETVDR
jgi:hypothetical protein